MLRIQSSPPRWVQHECNVSGCKEGMVSINGNEKLMRAMCAAPKEKTKCPVNLAQCCSRSPVTGGRYQLSSKYCSIHQHLSRASTSVSDDQFTLLVQIPLQLLSIGSKSLHSLSMIGSLPDSDSDDLLIGCCKPKKVNRFYDGTAGVVAALRPCGTVVNFSEMFTCESPTSFWHYTVQSINCILMQIIRYTVLHNWYYDSIIMQTILILLIVRFILLYMYLYILAYYPIMACKLYIDPILHPYAIHDTKRFTIMSSKNT